MWDILPNPFGSICVSNIDSSDIPGTRIYNGVFGKNVFGGDKYFSMWGMRYLTSHLTFIIGNWWEWFQGLFSAVINSFKGFIRSSNGVTWHDLQFLSSHNIYSFLINSFILFFEIKSFFGGFFIFSGRLFHTFRISKKRFPFLWIQVFLT